MYLAHAPVKPFPQSPAKITSWWLFFAHAPLRPGFLREHVQGITMYIDIHILIHNWASKEITIPLDVHICGRLVPKHRLISISIIDISLKLDILIHNWPRNTCSMRYTQYVYIIIWTSRKLLYKRHNNSRSSRHPSAADFFGCFGVFNTIVS